MSTAPDPEFITVQEGVTRLTRAGYIARTNERAGTVTYERQGVHGVMKIHDRQWVDGRAVTRKEQRPK